MSPTVRRRIAILALVLVLLFGLPLAPRAGGGRGLRWVRGQVRRGHANKAVPPVRRGRHPAVTRSAGARRGRPIRRV